VATVITAEPLTGSGHLVRPSVNGLTFIEAEPLRGSGLLVDPKVGSSNDVHSILDWTPNNNSEGNEIGGSVTVNFDADNTNQHEIDLASAGAYDTEGTHSGTEAIDTALQLATDSPLVTFEDYNVGKIQDAGQPDNWFERTATSGDWNLADDSDNWDGKHAQSVIGNTTNQETLDSAGTFTTGVFSADLYWDSEYGGGNLGIICTATGAGSAMRGHAVMGVAGDKYISLKRINSSTSFYGLYTYVHGTTKLEDTPYRLKVRVTTNGSSSWWYVKLWILGSESEPASWSYCGTDTAYIGAGYAGMMCQGGASGARHRFDNFKIEPDPAIYNTSGNWQSDPFDVSSVETLASSRIDFDTTTPTDTTAVVKCRWRDSDSWLTCTAGESLPGIDYREDMRTGATKDELEIRIELATTDTSVTPSVDNLVITFDPCDFDDCEIEIDGNSATRENGHLGAWGRRQVSAGVEIEAFDDLYANGFGFPSYRFHGEQINAKFIFDDYLLGEIYFSQLVQPFKFGTADGYFAFRFGAIESISRVAWTATSIWFNAAHDYQWTLIDKTQGIHADSWYWVGHAQADDFPGSMIAADPEESDFPGSILAKAYRRDDFLGETLVQGWRTDDYFGSLLVYLQTHNDFPGSAIVAIGHNSDFPGSLLVYGVNRNNEIEIHTIDADTVAALESLGFTFPPEAP
jgi:hypothetical protein